MPIQVNHRRPPWARRFQARKTLRLLTSGRSCVARESSTVPPGRTSLASSLAGFCPLAPSFLHPGSIIFAANGLPEPRYLCPDGRSARGIWPYEAPCRAFPRPPWRTGDPPPKSRERPLRPTKNSAAEGMKPERNARPRPLPPTRHFPGSRGHLWAPHEQNRDDRERPHHARRQPFPSLLAAGPFAGVPRRHSLQVLS